MKKFSKIIITCLLFIVFGIGLSACGNTTPERFTVTFYSEGQVFSTQTINKNSVAVAPNPEPEKTDYEFIGWYTDAGTLLKEFKFTTKIVRNTNLY